MKNTKMLFSHVADVYAKGRPAYPEAYFNLLKKRETIADIGAGTGILTEQLLETRLFENVYAVEPNPNMCKELRKNLSHYPTLQVKEETAENTTLLDNSVDIICAAQAFHWFDVEKFKRECQRIIKRDGEVHLLWNQRKEEDSFISLNKEILLKYCPGFQGFEGGREDIERRIESFFTPNEFEKISFDYPLMYTKEELIGRNMSSSFSPKENTKEYFILKKELERAFDEWQMEGKVKYAMTTVCYVGKV